MDSTKYEEILEANAQRPVRTLMLKKGWVFYQDNDPKHTWKSTMKYQEIRNGPPQSLDLNIIEHLRRDLKHAVHARRKNGEFFSPFFIILKL